MTLLQPGLSLWRTPPDPDAPPPMALGQALAHAARRWGAAEAVACLRQPAGGDRRWRFAELDREAERLAAALLTRGYAPGEAIAVWGSNEAAWTLLQYALAKAGLVLVALNPLYRRAELIHALNAAGAVAVFHADAAGGQALGALVDQVAAEVPTLRARHRFADAMAPSFEPSATASLPRVDPSAVLMIQYTSGTTGAPKAAQLTHAGVLAISRLSYRCWGFRSGDRICHGFPLFHVGGSGNSTPGALQVGATSLPLHIFNAGDALDILEQERCAGFIGVPTMLTAMMAHPSLPRRDLSALRCIVIGGAPVNPRLLAACEAAFEARACNGYGQTETGGVAASTAPDDPPERKTETSGRALPGVSVKVARPDGEAAPLGQAGSLWVASPGAMRGYVGQEPASPSEWIDTGDLAALDGDGFVRIVGRTKEMVIRGGENLYPAEIERLLGEHPDVAEIAVVGVPDAKYGEELCAAVRLRPGADLDEATFKVWCLAHISRWKCPRYVVFVDELPLTLSGKVIKAQLRDAMLAALGLAPA